MEEIRVGILLKDTIFSDAMARGLLRSGQHLRVYLSTIVEKKMEDYDVLITEEEYRYSLSKKAIDTPCIFLVNSAEIDEDSCGNSVSTEGGRVERKCFRYTDSPGLVAAVTGIHYDNTGKIVEFQGNHRFKTVVFTGSSGGCGVTSLAISSAVMLNMIYGKKTLFLNLSPGNDFVSFVEGSEDGQRGKFLKLMYYLSSDMQIPMSSVIRREEHFDYIAGNSTLRVSEIDKEVLQGLFKGIGRTGQYDYVFLDIGTCLTRNIIEIMRLADITVVCGKGKDSIRPSYQRSLEDKIRSISGNANFNVSILDQQDELYGYSGGEVDGTDDVIQTVAESEEVDLGSSKSGNHMYLISYEREAFVRMGGRIKIRYSGLYGVEVAAFAKGLDEYAVQ